MSDVVAIKALIRGRVQGVWYRSWTEEEATRRGLSGWVRNNPDGTVSALFVGPGDRVADMLEACRTGPLAARVDMITTTDTTPPAGETGFRVVR